MMATLSNLMCHEDVCVNNGGVSLDMHIAVLLLKHILWAFGITVFQTYIIFVL